jgi:hypothetical protein
MTRGIPEIRTDRGTIPACSTSRWGADTPTRVLMLVSGLDVRIVSEDGVLLRELVLDPSCDYQPMGSR